MTTPYVADEAGRLRGVVPGRCPAGVPGKRCAVVVNHRRERKTGPCHPVEVAWCRTHGGPCFTLYPPGHVPYGRVSATPQGGDGTVLVDREAGEVAWDMTVFRAAREAAAGKRWSPGSPVDDARRRRTQGRRLEQGARQMGVHPEQSAGERERIGHALGVPLLHLIALAAMYASGCWTERGRAVVKVLGMLATTGSLGDRLLAAGAVAGLWSAPRRWEPRGGSLLALGRTEAGERRSANPHRERAPPPTNSRGAPRGGPGAASEA